MPDTLTHPIGRPRRAARFGRFSYVGLGLLASATWLAFATPAAASVPPESTQPVPIWPEAPVDEGSVTILGNDAEPLTSGGSSTAYVLDLPDGAACPGDSASGNWYVQGFLIPAANDPGEIEYGVIGPEGTQFPLFAFDSRPYAHQLTQVSSSPDQPGVIPGLPEMSFAVFEPGYVPPGDYRIGIACTFFRQTARYWDTEIVIEADPADSPAQLTWRLPDAASFDASSVDDGSTSRWPIIAVILAVGLLAAWLLVRTPRRSADVASDDVVRSAGAGDRGDSFRTGPPRSDDFPDPSRSRR